MTASDIDRLWGELRDLRRRVDRLTLAALALASLLGADRLTAVLLGQ